ncbi:PREDICTED: bipolar kinesin KRP-130-like [Dinoponera quadriceps]|uniref:Bipolar kinesin KRP-130-like n=1 Tax=Dinoponera quadriceps TaxID=609295 RepID=A0A6P3WXC3_DINQU|nr:PREDICTED: bipolar kinesin KRP-130-like [Dinoponera quadriceps]
MKSDFAERGKSIEDNLAAHAKEIGQFFLSAKDEVESHIAAQIKSIKELVPSMLKDLIIHHLSMTEQLTEDTATTYERYNSLADKNIQDTSAIIEYEKNLLTAICSRLAPDIHNLLKGNGSVAENLQTLNNDISRKLEDVSAYARDVVEAACKYRLKECNSFRENLSEINEHINCMFLNQKQIVKDYKVFGKKMVDLSHDFMHLDKCEKNYAENINRSHHIDKICSNICDQAAHNCNADINARNNLEKFVQTNVSQIRSNIDNSLKEAETSDKAIMERGTALINNLEQNLSTGSATLKQYSSNVKSNVQQLQKEIIEDKNRTIATTDMIFKTVEDVNFAHSEFMTKQHTKISDFTTVIGNKLMVQDTELINWSNKMVKDLRTSQQQIDELFTKNQCLDVETGSTPSRKEFSYPRELATTLPHDQLIQKFRECKKSIEEADDSDSILTKKSTSEREKPLSVSDIPISNKITPYKKNKYSLPLSTSTPHINSNIKQSSTKDIFDSFKKSVLDFSRISISSPQSETEIYTEDNKENVKSAKSRKLKLKKSFIGRRIKR